MSYKLKQIGPDHYLMRDSRHLQCPFRQPVPMVKENRIQNKREMSLEIPFCGSWCAKFRMPNEISTLGDKKFVRLECGEESALIITEVI